MNTPNVGIPSVEKPSVKEEGSKLKIEEPPVQIEQPPSQEQVQPEQPVQPKVPELEIRKTAQPNVSQPVEQVVKKSSLKFEDLEAPVINSGAAYQLQQEILDSSNQ